MKTPCEITVHYILPTIRRELAREMVTKHNLSKATVARLFCVTNSAISQYLHADGRKGEALKGGVENSEFRAGISSAAQRIIDGSDIITETCKLCQMIRRDGLLVDLPDREAVTPFSQCSCSICCSLR
jgi:predicted transcriptional regulator